MFGAEINIDHESNGGRNKTVSTEKYLDKIR